MEFLLGFYFSTAVLIFLWSLKRIDEVPKVGLLICSIVWLPVFLGGLILDLVLGDYEE